MPTYFVVDDSAVDRKLAGSVLEKMVDTNVCYFSDGRLALEQLPLLQPDLVVSDLHMPHMDGLQLVGELHRRYPRLPVIVMTGQGSEDLAIQALSASAAGYVPKRRLVQDLAGTVERVFAKVIHERQISRVTRRISQQEVTFILENDASLLVSLAMKLRETVHAAWQCGEVQILRIGMAIEEALMNACFHGNLELSSSLRDQDDDLYRQLARERSQQAPFAQRRIMVQFQCGTRSFRCTIRDDGPGFDPDSQSDPFSDQAVARPSGRGLTLIRAFMDEVRFNDRGNEITLFKRRPHSEASALNSDGFAIAAH
ncbi:MAG: ATP-binding protein [Planctomycetaceae bacterium]|nr:ATP-binding protein [Planctomycetaceae bacterium]